MIESENSTAPDKAPEKGGILLITIGASPEKIAKALKTLKDEACHISVLITPDQKHYVAGADEIWVAHRLGLRGIFALVRRIAWRRFSCVYQLAPSFTLSFKLSLALTLLRLAIIPHPVWRHI